jgi:hypothetical protein
MKLLPLSPLPQLQSAMPGEGLGVECCPCTTLFRCTREVGYYNTSAAQTLQLQNQPGSSTDGGTVMQRCEQPRAAALVCVQCPASS